MSDENIKLRKTRQYLQRATKDKFWSEMNVIHTQAYLKAMQHVQEALGCIAGITKKQAEAVLAKAKDIREHWDGMQEVEVTSAIEQITQNGKEAKT